MKNLSIVFMAAAALTSFGCKKKGGAGEAMGKMTELKDKMCGCKDKACADKVQDEMNKWSADNAKNAGDSKDKPDEKTMKEMQDVGTKYGECMAKAMGGGDTPPPPPPAGSDSGSGSAAAAGSGSAAAPAADAPKVGEGPVVKSATLATITMGLPKPKGAPETGEWKTVPGGKDGDRLTNYKVGNDMWMSLQFTDCNMPLLKDYISKPAGDRGALSVCFDAPTGKLKDYPMLAPNDTLRTIKVGHVAVTASVALAGQDKLKAADLEAFLSSLDLASLTAE